MKDDVIKSLMRLKTEVNRALDAVQVGDKVPFALSEAYIRVMEQASSQDLAELPPLG